MLGIGLKNGKTCFNLYTTSSAFSTVEVLSLSMFWVNKFSVEPKVTSLTSHLIGEMWSAKIKMLDI